jgi:hypothetical protein
VRPSSRVLAPPYAAALLAALTCLLFVAAGGGTAHAEKVWAKNAELGGEGFENGQFEGAGSPNGLAIAPSGELYAVNNGAVRVEKFDSSIPASFLLAFGWGVHHEEEEKHEYKSAVCMAAEDCFGAGSAGSEPGQFGSIEFGMGVAVSPTNSDVYVVDTSNSRVEYFESDGKYVGEFNGSPNAPQTLSEPTGIAVGPSGSVYVFNLGAHVVDKFSATGAYESEFNGSESPYGSFGGQFGDNLAVDPSGHVYVGDEEHSVVDEFGPEGKYITDFGGGELSSGGNGMAVAVDSAGDVFAANEGTHEIYEFEPDGAPVAKFGGGLLSGYNLGIATAGSGSGERVYVSDGIAHEVYVFTPGPACTTGTPATSINASGATVVGTIEPNGIEATYHVEYGLTTTPYEFSTASAGPVSGISSVPVTAKLEGLQEPHQTYHYQLVINFGADSLSCGDQTFQTEPAKPVVDQESAPAATTSGTEAILEAQVNANNEETTYHADYSTERSGETLVSPQTSPDRTIPSHFGDEPAHPTLTGLLPSTTYFYRVIATNGAVGQDEGPIETFLTRPATPATGSASAVAQSRATLSGSLNPGGHEAQSYFEYGEAPCAPTSCGAKTTEEAAGSGSGEVDASASLNGLKPSTTYHYRLVAINATGSSNGPEGEFTTGWPAITGPAGSVGSTTATVGGEVVAAGLPTTYRIEYGPTTVYGASAPTPEGEEASTNGQYVIVTLEGLTPSTTYHYRLVTINSAATGEGEDRTFTTNPAGEPNTALPAGFSLTGAAPVGPAATIYPNLTALGPVPPPTPPSTPTTTKPLTKAQKLSKALKQCKKDKSKHKRVRCEKQARTEYKSATKAEK